MVGLTDKEISDLFPEELHKIDSLMAEQFIEPAEGVRGEGLGDMERKLRVQEQIDNARKILGKERVLGPEEWRSSNAAWTKTPVAIDWTKVPEIPFSDEELETAKKNGKKLALSAEGWDFRKHYTFFKALKEALLG
ncbi:MAG TPA: hypothetical protein P5056_03420 [Candidatus Paceibacterota bacterium]|nr:hypothetical protein [Candidatus Paceibacterota bacterium]